MPRQAHGRPLQKPDRQSQPKKRKPLRKQALNALEIAERQNPDETKIRQNRLGQVEDDSDDPAIRDDIDDRSTKRRKVTDTDEDEIREEGSDLEGNTWHVGVDDEDEDSDIDSEEAFGESDEERFAGYTFRGSDIVGAANAVKKSVKKPIVKKVTLDEDEGWEDAEAFNDGDEQDAHQDEDEEMYDDDLGDEAIDLATALDLDEADELKQAAKKRVSKAKKQQPEKFTSSEEDSEEGSEEGSEDENEGDQLSLSEDDVQGDHAGLRRFVVGLTPKTETVKTKPSLDRKSLSSKPSQYGLSSAKISASDLLQYVKDPTQRQALRMIQNSEQNGPDEYKGGIPGKLAVPLAKRQQDKLDRGAAYEKSKETLNRWVDTVKNNRRAEHISFPLPDPAAMSATGQKQLAPTSQSVPVTSLESTIQTIMQESGIGMSSKQSLEGQEQAYEELEERKIPLDEVKARRAELRKARELMFREEIRAKRIKKIKSRAYRRVHRKERDRIEAQTREQLAASGLLNSDEEREKNDRRRAEERMGARHRESKWAKGVKSAGRATWDDDARTGVSDLARRDEELRRRVEGKIAHGSDASDLESESDTDYDGDSETDGRRIQEKLDELQADEPTDSKSRLASMEFMKRAEASRKAENDENLRQLRLATNHGKDDSLLSESDEEPPVGRQKFGVRTQEHKKASEMQVNQNEFEAPVSGSDSEDDATPAEFEVREPAAQTSAAIPNTQQLKGKIRAGLSSKVETRDRLQRTGPPKQISDGKTRAVVRSTHDHSLNEYTSPSEFDDEGGDLPNTIDSAAALAASIFAGPDDTMRKFREEKKEVEEEEGDQVVDNTLPGWGSWAGAGVSKREQKRNKGRYTTTIKGVAPEKRQDAKLDRVIINEKRVKKNGKYLATELPHPFENRQQYERSLRLPIGPEWSTTNHYQGAIKPRVLLKQGTIIKPMAKPIA